MKLIDLLNKIANGEEDLPKKIKYMGYIFEYDTNHKRYESYFDEQIWTLNDFVNVDDNLNDTVEILEEEKKIPEKLKWIDYNIEFTRKNFNKEFRNICNTIDEIIDYLDYLKSKGE